MMYVTSDHVVCNFLLVWPVTHVTLSEHLVYSFLLLWQVTCLISARVVHQFLLICRVTWCVSHHQNLWFTWNRSDIIHYILMGCHVTWNMCNFIFQNHISYGVTPVSWIRMSDTHSHSQLTREGLFPYADVTVLVCLSIWSGTLWMAVSASMIWPLILLFHFITVNRSSIPACFTDGCLNSYGRWICFFYHEGLCLKTGI